jgi:hypothetical protein
VTVSHQGLLQAVGHLLIWDEWARDLVGLPLWVGVQSSARLRRFVGFLQCIGHSHVHRYVGRATYGGMRLDTERWSVLALILSPGLVGWRRLAKTRLLLRGELGFDLLDEGH